MDYERLREALSHRSPGPIDGRPPCAVLVPLIRHNGENCLLFEVRSPALKWQPGEVCFPGGRMEPGETAQAWAQRATGDGPRRASRRRSGAAGCSAAACPLPPRSRILPC